MSKTMIEAIHERHPTLCNYEYPVVTASSAGEKYHPDQWPPSGFGSAPSLATIQAWMQS